MQGSRHQGYFTSGPAACITALTMSGRETRRFAFEAFLPADKNERKEVLAELACETRTMIIYEAPHRLTKTLAELQDTLGGDRQITICKELTKRYENSMEFTLNLHVNIMKIMSREANMCL